MLDLWLTMQFKCKTEKVATDGHLVIKDGFTLTEFNAQKFKTTRRVNPKEANWNKIKYCSTVQLTF